MDYKKLVEYLKSWEEEYISSACGDGHLQCEHFCVPGKDCLVTQAIDAITTLMARAEAAEARAEKAETENKDREEASFREHADTHYWRDRARAAEARAEKAEKQRDAAVSDLMRAEESAEETNALLDDEVHPEVNYSLYLSIHDSVSDIVNWRYDNVWREQKEE